MNPQVRVTKKKGPVPRQEISKMYLLRDIESLYLESPETLKAFKVDHGSSNKVEENRRYAKIARHISKDSMTQTSMPKGKTKKLIEENTINIRASSVPRPRAVLSSPDNDGIFGSRNKQAQEKVKSAERPSSGAQSPTPIPCAFNGRRNRHNLPSTQRAATLTENSRMYPRNTANKSTYGTEKHHEHPKASGGTAAVEMHPPLKENCSEIGDGNGYPKIRCRELNQLMTPKPRTAIKKGGR